MKNSLSQDAQETADFQASSSPKNAAKWMRIIGGVEGTSFLLLLFIAMPLKYLGENPLLVKLLGPVHGWLFLLYLVSVVVVARLLKWRWFYIVLAFGASVVPFGPFIFEAWLRRNFKTQA